MRAGDGVEAGKHHLLPVPGLGEVPVEERADLVVEYLPPELEVAVAVLLAVSNQRTTTLVEVDEPGLGGS